MNLKYIVIILFTNGRLVGKKQVKRINYILKYCWQKQLETGKYYKKYYNCVKILKFETHSYLSQGSKETRSQKSGNFVHIRIDSKLRHVTSM